MTLRFGVLLLASLTLAACTEPKETPLQADAAPARQLPQREALWGGDTRAWLIHHGNPGNSGYCAARLRLPLQPEPAWELSYSAAEFSEGNVRSVLHYDGSLVVNAASSQLLVVDAATGEITFNEPVYEFGGGQMPTQESMRSTFFSPLGLLFALDDRHRIYCLELDDGLISRRWLRDGAAPDSVLVSSDRQLFCYDQTMLRSYDLAGGAAQWSFPLTEPSNGMTLARDGTLVWYSGKGLLRAIDPSDGRGMWTVHLDAGLRWAMVDDERAALLVIRDDERLECRDLGDGALRWTFDWSVMLPREEREALIQRYGTDQLPLRVHGISAGPAGVALVLQSGNVLLLDGSGALRWQQQLDTALGGGAIMFSNALLVPQVYGRPNPEWFDQMDYFNEQNPGWAVIERFERQSEPDVVSEEEQEGPRQRMGRGIRPEFTRFAALDLADGAVLDTFEVPLSVECSSTPAGRLLVLGGGQHFDEVAERRRIRRSGGNVEGRPKRWLYAYDWLEPES